MKKVEKLNALEGAKRQRKVIYEVYCDGVDAARAGEPRSANPYGDRPGKKAEFDNWNHGWLAGKGKAKLDSKYEPITDFRFELYDG